jgi:hypothetical protein
VPDTAAVADDVAVLLAPPEEGGEGIALDLRQVAEG